jgi:hypothetical protein
VKFKVVVALDESSCHEDIWVEWRHSTTILDFGIRQRFTATVLILDYKIRSELRECVRSITRCFLGLSRVWFALAGCRDDYPQEFSYWSTVFDVLSSYVIEHFSVENDEQSLTLFHFTALWAYHLKVRNMRVHSSDILQWLTNYSLIQEETKSTLSSGDACYRSVQNLLSSYSLRLFITLFRLPVALVPIYSSSLYCKYIFRI